MLHRLEPKNVKDSGKVAQGILPQANPFMKEKNSERQNTSTLAMPETPSSSATRTSKENFSYPKLPIASVHRKREAGTKKPMGEKKKQITQR